ncbi:dihydrofolate reductase family protein [Microbacterium sp. M3]|uniref:Dihydrofolate reductase family protein n=1 Tax=Microbacterium arthrosphaerae TaxID=792652 RepID=A0ABU4H517_9MICO|nr:MULTISPECIES: dihydrofolate reductase family protein [Microbacterium]MDW4574442.1 dihydrofolate reductase family protein [Microbacterium arthrosphaerae]MDW7608297.1 dihydrofolate reductase family protein [Microbacterium sp. M3]
MSRVILYASMSVDGFATGPDDDLSVLHGWAFGDPTMAMHPTVTEEFFAAGAVIFGARTLRAGDAAWGDESIFPMPVFVPTHERREPVVRNGALFTFTDSAEEALRQATAAAGDRDVYIMGSPDVARQLIDIDAVDVFELAVTGVLLGAGIRLFGRLAQPPVRLDPTRVLESKRITHIRYEVLR